MMTGNALLHGDNLCLLREYIADESIDLIYIDPPFASNRHYGAFSDIWKWNEQSSCDYRELTAQAQCPSLPLVLHVLGCLHSRKPLMAYLVFMALRLIELNRILKSSGTFYLHCDTSAVNELALMLDAIFGAEMLRNKITWKRTFGHNTTKSFGRISDTILFYTKTDDYMFHSEFAELGDVWLDIPPVGSMTRQSGAKGVSYPTGKPEPLLERIILSSSNPGDLVLDCFCGGGTTLIAAQKTGRRWIGLDASPLSIQVTKDRLEQAFPEIKGTICILE